MGWGVCFGVDGNRMGAAGALGVVGALRALGGILPAVSVSEGCEFMLENMVCACKNYNGKVMG